MKDGLNLGEFCSRSTATIPAGCRERRKFWKRHVPKTFPPLEGLPQTTQVPTGRISDSNGMRYARKGRPTMLRWAVGRRTRAHYRSARKDCVDCAREPATGMITDLSLLKGRKLRTFPARMKGRKDDLTAPGNRRNIKVRNVPRSISAHQRAAGGPETRQGGFQVGHSQLHAFYGVTRFCCGGQEIRTQPRNECTNLRSDLWSDFRKKLEACRGQTRIAKRPELSGKNLWQHHC